MFCGTLECEELVVVVGAASVEGGGLGFRFGRRSPASLESFEGGGRDVGGSSVRPEAECTTRDAPSNVHGENDEPGGKGGPAMRRFAFWGELAVADSIQHALGKRSQRAFIGVGASFLLYTLRAVADTANTVSTRTATSSTCILPFLLFIYRSGSLVLTCLTFHPRTWQ